MPSFYASIHEIVGELMYADNFFIALYDDRRSLINFAFYRDEVDLDVPDPNRWEPLGSGEGAGLTGYLLRRGEPVLWTREEYQQIVQRGDADLIGEMGVDWMGVPLRSDGRTIGAVVTQSYREDRHHSARDLELLAFVAQHIGTALTRARAIEETRQRNAELAIVNEVGQALAKQLDFDGILEAVGARAAQALNVDGLSIAIHDREADVTRFLYWIDGGKRRRDMEGKVLGDPLTAEILRSGRPLRIQSAAEAIELGMPFKVEGTESYLGAPIPAADRPIGVIAMGTNEPNTYTEADERLLTTFATAMGQALENARLFEETKRLLAETDERAAELAIINSVQQGLAENLEMQAMYDLVGDKIREIFDAQVVDIGIIDRDADLMRYPYTIERGVRLPDQPTKLADSAILTHLIDTRQPLSIPDFEIWDREHVGHTVVQGENSKSALFAPLLGAGEVRGRISIQNLDRTHAYSERDLRLLTTLAAEPERGARERTAVRRDEAAARGDRRACRRAGHHQQRAAGPGREPRHAGHVRPGRRQDPRDLRCPGRRHRHHRPRRQPVSSAIRTRSSAASDTRMSPRRWMGHSSST